MLYLVSWISQVDYSFITLSDFLVLLYFCFVYWFIHFYSTVICCIPTSLFFWLMLSSHFILTFPSFGFSGVWGLFTRTWGWGSVLHLRYKNHSSHYRKRRDLRVGWLPWFHSFDSSWKAIVLPWYGFNCGSEFSLLRFTSFSLRHGIISLNHKIMLPFEVKWMALAQVDKIYYSPLSLRSI